MEESDDELLRLPEDTLSALEDFISKRDSQNKHFEIFQSTAGDERGRLSMDMFPEDWNASQFWCTDATALTLATHILEGASLGSAIAVVSTPSVFVQLNNMLLDVPKAERPLLKLLEFDERFANLPGFVRYDFNSPFGLPSDLKGRFDRVVCDPPFHSEDCQTKMAMTVRWLLDPTANMAVKSKIVVCTGERMADLIPKVYPGCKATDFQPQHNGLSNEYLCYANFECNGWHWVCDEAGTPPKASA